MARFQKPGSLERPGPVGRLTRFVFGVGCLYFVFSLLAYCSERVISRVPDAPGLWVMMFLGFHLFSYIINIGFTCSWGRRPQLLVIAAAMAMALLSLFSNGKLWGPPLGWFVFLWLLYVYVHLGISFILSSAIGTPGCEMRAIPYLWMMMSGHETAEHYCPAGPLSGIDAWEASWRKRVQPAESRDSG